MLLSIAGSLTSNEDVAMPRLVANALFAVLVLAITSRGTSANCGSGATTTISLTSNYSPATTDDKVILIATVSPSDAAGSVEFFDDDRSLGTAPVIGGEADLSLFFEVTGEHVLRATYTPSDCHSSSTSEPYFQLIIPPGLAVQLNLFEATTVNEGIELRWQFGDPSDLVSAWVERSATAAGPWTRIEPMVAVRDGITVGIDREVDSDRSYSYRLVASLLSGGSQDFGPIEARSGERVSEFAIASITPNPVRSQASIEYTVAKGKEVSLRLIDLQGRVIARLVEGAEPVGRHQVAWTRGRVPAGVYFVRYQVPGKVLTRRIVLE